MEQQWGFFFNLGNGERAHFDFLAGPGNLARKIRQEAELNVKFWSLD
jgi:hypothetical protein